MKNVQILCKKNLCSCFARTHSKHAQKGFVEKKIEKDMHLVYTADLDVLCKYGAHKSPKEEKKINLITGW